jgi:hypothetical protein
MRLISNNIIARRRNGSIFFVHWVFIGVFIFDSFALLTNFANAGTLLKFDDNVLIAEESNGHIYGYYGFIHEINPFSCVFLFYASKNKGKDNKITGFITDSTYELRDKEYDSDGRIYTNERGEWIIQFDHAPDPGCLNLGSSFRETPGDDHPRRFTIEKRANILGIRMISNQKSFFYDLDNNNFTARKSYLTSTDVVIVFKEKNKFSYVQYRHVRSSKITNGWVKTADLKNPFPEN